MTSFSSPSPSLNLGPPLATTRTLKTVAELVRRGIVESVPASDRRARRIRLSARGWEAVTFTRRVRRRLEERLRRAIGPAEYRRAKRVLLNGLRLLGGMQRIRTRRI